MSARSEVDVVDLVPVDKVADALPYIATSGSAGGRGGQQAEDHVPLLEGYADALPMRCPARGRWSIVLRAVYQVLWLITIHADNDTY
jgi:hypothetical protein